MLDDQAIHDPNGDWWYVVGPGLDEPLLAVKRGFSGMANATQLWLPVVSDDRGQLIAIADSGGQLQGSLIGPQYDAGLWNSSGLTSHAQSFNPRRWATPGGIDTISTFRSRQYDPATGKWLQEDPMGIAGGVNLYGYNGNDPNSFSDPFGLCADANGKPRKCEVTLSATGRAAHTSLEALAPGIRDKLNKVAIAADVDLGVNYTTNGSHEGAAHPEGRAVDIGEINGARIGVGKITSPGMEAVAAKVQAAAAGLGGLQPIGGDLGPAGQYLSGRGPFPIPTPRIRDEHKNHVHLAWEQ